VIACHPCDRKYNIRERDGTSLGSSADATTPHSVIEADIRAEC
jgi:hypothetical protein